MLLHMHAWFILTTKLFIMPITISKSMRSCKLHSYNYGIYFNSDCFINFRKRFLRNYRIILLYICVSLNKNIHNYHHVKFDSELNPTNILLPLWVHTICTASNYPEHCVNLTNWNEDILNPKLYSINEEM